MDRSSLHVYVQSFYNHLESSFLSNQLHLELNQMKDTIEEMLVQDNNETDKRVLMNKVLLASAPNLSEVTATFLEKLLGEDDPSAYLEAIDEFNRFYSDDNEPINVTLTTAKPLEVEQRDRIIKVFRTKVSNHHLFIKELVDPSVIAGVRLESDNFYFDNTLQSKLHDMKSHLLQDE